MVTKGLSRLLRYSTAAAWLALSISGSSAMAEVVVVVSTQSAVTSLSKSQVADIFLGKTRRFPNGAVAAPIDQAEGSATRDEFYMNVAARSPAQVKSHWSKIIFTGRGQPPPAVSNDGEVKKRIAANPAAIGYIDRRLLDASVREVR
jgi:ABC-type phosphate transport system substrate-binding protein